MLIDATGNVIAAGQVMNGTGAPQLIVVKLAATDGVEEWQAAFDGNASYPSLGNALVALDPSGDVLAAGTLGGAMIVAKISHTTGDVLWQKTVDGAAGVSGIAVNSTGDVAIAGGPAFFLVKLAGANGSEVWRGAIDDFIGSEARVKAVAFDHDDAVIAVGWIGGDEDRDIYAIKLDGTTGGEIWHQDIDDGPVDLVYAVALDAADNAFVVGSVGDYPGLGVPTLFMAKLNGTDGDVLWGGVSDTFDQVGFAVAVAVDGNGDVVAGGAFVHPPPNAEPPSALGIVKRAGATGNVLWQQEPFPIGNDNDTLESLAIGKDGGVVVAGVVSSAAGKEFFAVAKLAGATGAPIWTKSLKGGEAAAVAIDPVGDVAAAGILSNSFFVTKFGPPTDGASIVVQDKASDPTKRKIQVQAKDKDFLASGPGSTGDPTLNGATLKIENPNTHETVLLMLPAMNWTGMGKPAGAKGYKYADKKPFEGSCTTASIKNGKWQATCKGDQIGFTLDEPSQASLAATLTVGTESSCLFFGGTVVKDVPTAGKTLGTFQAKKAPEPQVCF